MRDKRFFRWGKFLKQVFALALTFVGIWIMSLTADFSGINERLKVLAADADFSTNVITTQLAGFPTRSAHSGWEQILLAGSSLMRSAAGQVSASTAPAPVADSKDTAVEEEHTLPNLQPAVPTPQDSDVVSHTAVGRNDGSFLSLDNLYIKNNAGLPVDVSALAAANIDLNVGDGPQILIYHTHATESYTMDGDDVYFESDAYRTTDNEHNVVRVGEEIANVFRDAGFEVIHDTTLYDYPNYTNAYQRSRAGVAAILEQYPSICFTLDVHRDAIVSEEGLPFKLICEVDNEPSAQVMFVVGTNDGGAQHDNWRQNLALAIQLQLKMADQYHQLARPINLSSSRYNQDMTSGSLLVEIGGHGNTLQEALLGARSFANSAALLLKEQASK